MIDKILQVYKADVSDAKAKVKELSGEQKKAAQEHVKQLEAQNKTLDDHIATIGKVAVAVAVVGGVAKFMWDDYKERAEKARLSTAAFGVDITALGGAALGTKNQLELLGDAAKMNNGVFKLTSDQMAIVERAMIGLIRRGHESADVNKKVLDAITQLKIDGLQDLGLVVDKTGTNIDSAEGRYKLFVNTLSSLSDVSKEVVTTQRTLAEEAERAAARATDAWKEFKEEWITGDAGANLLFDAKYRKAFAQNIRDRAAARGASGNMNFDEDMAKAIGVLGQNAQRAQAYASQFPKFGHELEMQPMNIGQERDARKAAAKQLADELKKLSNEVAKELTDDLLKELEENAQGVDELVGTLDGGTTESIYKLLGGENQRDLTYGDSEQGKAGARRDSMLERMFGPIDEFAMYQTAFDGLTTVVTGSFEAWIDGSMSVGAAFRQLGVEVLKAGAVQLMGEGIKHGVYALGTLAFGGPLAGAKAAAHGKAAAAAFAGAAVLGTLAKGLGAGAGGSGSGGGGGGAAPTGSSSSGQSGGGGNTYVVNYGDAFAEDSVTMRNRNARKMIDSVMGSPGVK